MLKKNNSAVACTEIDYLSLFEGIPPFPKI
jgi:hypothetical protein